MKLPISFFDSKHTGDILQRMSDQSRIEHFLTGSALNTLFSFVSVIMLSIVLAIYNTGIFTIFLISAILYSAWVIVFLKQRKNLDYSKFAIAAREQSIKIQIVQGMQEIKLCGAERPMRWNWERLQAKLFGLSIKGLSLNQWQQAGAFFINEGNNIFITFLAATSVINGHMTLGAMLAVQYIVGQLNSPIEQMIQFVQSFQDARISLERLNEIHSMANEEPEELKLQQNLPLEFQRQLSGGNGSRLAYVEKEWEQTAIEPERWNEPLSLDQSCITFKNVSFTYSGAGNEPVLKNIHLRIPLGKTTAIVGVSGSGKTTLVKLLLKFYEPQKGEIHLGPTPLSFISHKYWRKHCGVVMQESFIFSDTIARNIAVGEENIDQSRLHYAAKIANIQEFTSGLALGYNTKIGTEGVGISMGQKQRILIARAVYRNPSFIFLDEATNSLDANNESVIVHNLQSFFADKTVIIVAHRLSTVRNADQIVVLDNGEIVEKGTHQELTNLKGHYYRLVKNQLELGL